MISLLVNKINIISSKQRPKTFRVITSDGNSHKLLLKNESNGDLRKDMRTMEFTGYVNLLLRTNPDTSPWNLFVQFNFHSNISIIELYFLTYRFQGLQLYH